MPSNLALYKESPHSADSAIATEIEALKAQISALSKKVSIPYASKTEVHTLQERLVSIQIIAPWPVALKTA